MVYVHDLEIEVNSSEGVGSSDGVTPSDALTKTRTLNESIGILLRSYTRAINKQENSTGSVFRKETKAECLTNANGIIPSFYGSHINVRIPEKEYPQACFNYIHQNPVKANLVKLPEEWEFSSYPDYCGIRDGKLINRARTVEFGLVV